MWAGGLNFLGKYVSIGGKYLNMKSKVNFSAIQISLDLN